MLREASVANGLSLDVDKIEAVILSHLHADHASGLEDFIYYSKIALNRRAKIVAHPDVAARLWETLAPGMETGLRHDGQPPARRTLGDLVDLSLIRERETVEVGPFRISCRRTKHSVPCTAFRIQAANRTLGYSADTRYDADLIAWLVSSDLILHEATNQTSSDNHTPYASLLKLPEFVKQKLRLYHLPDDFNREASEIGPLTPFKIVHV